jgi:mRNA-degrading endonuclease RelE of RelBE toxin-antitoxin system
MATILAMPKSPFEIVFDERTFEHLDAIESKYDSVIREAIETQLAREPNLQTRNRKPMIEPTEFGATWELRCGPSNRFRIYYDVNLDERTVVILAIGVKIRNEVWLGKERFEL